MGNGLRTDPVGGIAAPPFSNGPYNWDQRLRLDNHFIQSPGRYRLEEFFSQTPGVNADLASATEATRVPRNKHFEVLGTNGTSALATFSATEGALTLTTAGADNDQMILLPHLDTKQTAWTGVLWGTENEVIMECAVRTGASIAGVLLWCGLKLTNTPTVATDDDQALFRFSTDDSDTNWELVSSVGGTDSTADSGVAVAVSSTYLLRVEVDSSRVAHFFINNVEVGKSSALTDDVDLIPYVGVQALTGAAKAVSVGYVKISRVLFE